VVTAVNRQVLVVSSEAANRRAIEEVTRAWMIDAIVCSSLQESRAVLSKQGVAAVFCEDRLTDGTYRDLLPIVPKVPVIVMISDGKDESADREAIALGALDVIGSPCSRQDVQWMIIRTIQDRSTGTR
jgi:DNA-binding NtrC family response regulator